ncbi:hypothetical protein CSB07_00345 [Candidatus Gracilibacteria bacterium]|nr:MAG: hypothetical protein CSB07_00345 [Candidatus Gracilibacteria bacterium]PIE85128.1 MAG: hypothetical protein CSA08_03725 [Candidatus Gracilibacteria bacterium]
MIKNKNGESLVGILMGMFILGLVLLGIANIILNSRELSYQALADSSIYFIKNNSINVLNSSDLSNLNIGEEFYINKDKNTQTINILTGSTNEPNMYVDRHGYKVDDINTFSGFIYTQTGKVTSINNNLGFEHIKYDLTIKEY